MRLIMSTLYVLMAFLWLKMIRIYVKDLISLLAQKEKKTHHLVFFLFHQASK